MNSSRCKRHAAQLALVIGLSLALILSMAAFGQSSEAMSAQHPTGARPLPNTATLAGNLAPPDAPAISPNPVSPQVLSVAAQPVVADAAPEEMMPLQNVAPRALPLPPDHRLLETTSDAVIPSAARPPGGLASFGAADQMGRLSIPPMPGDANFVVDLTTDRVWGKVTASATVTATVNGTQCGASEADGLGFFWTTLYDGNGDRPYLNGGETVAIHSDGAQEASVTLRSISGQIDVLSDIVSGAIGSVSSPISVTVYTGGGEPSMTSYSQTISTDGSGNFTADFAGGWDFYADETAVVAYVENDVEVHRQVYAQRLVIQPFPRFGLGGWATPGVVVTATVYSDSTTVRWQKSDTTDAGTGRYWMSPDLEEGDVVKVEVAGGPVLSRTVDHLTLPDVDASSDRITGYVEPLSIVRGRTNNLTPLGRRSVQMTTTADATGVYTLEFGAIADIMPGQWAGVYISDAEGDDLNLWAPAQGSVEVHQTWNEVSGWAVALPGPLAEGRLVTLTLASTTTTYSKEMGWYGQYSFNQDDRLPDIAPGEIVTVESEGYAWQGVVQVQSITVQHDVNADQFTGTVVTPTERVELWGAQWAGWSQIRWLYPIAGSFDTLAAASSPFTATPAGFDVRNAVGYEVIHRTVGDYAERVYQEVDYLRVWPDYNVTWALFGPSGTPYTLTLRDGGGGFKAQLTGTSDDPIGHAGWNDFWSENEQIETGDQLQAQSAAGFSQTVHIPAMTLQFDEADNKVSGTAPANTLLYISVDNQGEGFVPTDGSGQFAVAVDQLQSFNGDGDLVWGNGAMLCYVNEDANQVCRNFGWPQITANYDMEGSSQVWGNGAIPGNTIYITVTDPGSTMVASGTTSAGACDGCGTTDYQLNFPDGAIVPSNTVTVNWGDGYVDSTVVVTITANPDVDTEIVTGTAPADSRIHINAEHAWGDWVDIGDIQVDAGGIYTVNFGAKGWDIQYGDRLNIHYSGYHNHQTQYSFWIPAPELEIQKETVNGHAIPGGRVMYRIRYYNNGNGDAENTIITDTLPMSTTYAANSGGFPAVTDGSIVTFSLGTVTPKLNPWDGEDFYVSLIVDSSVPTQTHLHDNCVGISTSSPGDYDMGNNQACSDGAWVDDGQWGLWVDKWPEPNDPHPGQTFQYVIDYGTDGGAANGPAWLTDTLPADTEVISWYDEWDWGGLWTEVITTGGQFVLYAPAGVPGDMGGRIRLTLLLDGSVSIGTRLENTVVITTSGDLDPGNNEDFDNNAQASGARYDMQVDKYFDNGQLVPGGEIYYSIQYRNQGNAAVNAWVTDTLPAGTSFDSAWTQGWDSQPLVPSVVTSDYVVWDLGVVDVSDNVGFNVQLNISTTVTPGDVLTNCATVGIAQTEDTPSDNESCVATTVYSAGRPNLYVTKELRDNYEPGHGNINYRIRFGNYGDQTVYDVHITDTLPISTSLGGHNVNWWGSQYTDTTPSGELRVLFERIEPGWSGEIDLSVNLDDSNRRLLWYTNTVEIETPSNDANPADNSDTYVAFSGGEVDRVDLRVARDANAWGQAQPNVPITVTTALTQYTGWVGGGGDWDISNVEAINPGDTFTVTAGSGTMPVVVHVPAPYTAYASSITDTVWGQIDAEQVTVDPDNGPAKDVQTDGSGAYSAVFSDIPRGGQGEVRYDTESDYADVCLRRSFLSPDLIVTVDYDRNWVEGNYEAGHTVWLTVTESDRTTVKGTAVLTTGVVPWWDGQTGFSTNWQGWTIQPDIVPGDWVYGLLNSESYTTTVRVGAINGEVGVGADTISGTLGAPWLGSPVTVKCEIHEENGDSIEVYNVDPDGGSFFCDFAGRYDIMPGTNVAVHYTEPDGDRVQAYPSNPAPYLQIQKQADGNPGEGGNFAFQVQYWNSGGLDAENVVITDTLQGMTYLTDTSGFPHTGSGSGPVVWDLGALPPNSSGQFDVFVEITAVASDTITNTAQIATSDPYDQGEPHEKESQWSGPVEANDTHLNVGKGAWTGDPAPGYDFVYSVNVCNNGSTGSTEVVLTDTLHLSTTLQSWWGQRPGWTEVLSTSDQLVLSRPSIPGWWCSEVYLRVHLDDTAWSSMYITNTAVISAGNDMEGNDNEAFWDGWVKDPHTNLDINKQWHGGQLVPGGEARYWINYHNSGNVPVTSTIRITDTLPVSTTFVAAWRYDQSGQHPVTPVFTGTAYVMWEINGLDNGYGDGFEVLLNVDYAASPGTVLTNTVEISPQPGEDSYDDNVSTVVETLYDHGPNVRVRKSGYWHDWGSNTRQAEYNVSVENVGDEHADWVTITDTYPNAMYLNGGIGLNYQRWWDWYDYAASGYFTVTLESLYPSENVNINFTTITDTEPLPFGLVFTNTAEVMLDPDDTHPADNVDDHVLTTGPDLYVEKTLVAGGLLPDELVIFSLTFGNKREGHEWWWNTQGDAWLTDTLPSGLEFITSTLQSCGGCPYAPESEDGIHYAWNIGSMSTGYWDEIYLTVRITDTATGLDTFTNWVEIASDQPGTDVEPYYDNNEDSHDVVIAQPYFQVDKVYLSSRIAGMPVTYTLTVTNTGTEAGTNVVLSDTLPAGLTYGGSDGTFAGGDVIWNFASIASYGGTASGWFSGALPCTTGSVTNDDYRVVSSDEGVDSLQSAPVVFSIVAPAVDAAFDVSVDTVVASTTIHFTGTSTTDGTPIVAWEWDFDDGSAHAFTQNASHTYLSDGTFTARLTVTDACGYNDVQTATVEVNAPDLVAAFDLSTDTVVVSTTIHFTDTSTTDGTPIVQWEWDFDDGSTSIFTQNASHTYLSDGTFTVRLTVTDTSGYNDIQTATVEVNRPDLVAAFDHAPKPANIISGNSVIFTDTSTTNGPAIIAWAWAFGDGGTSGEQDPAHIYDAVGTFGVTLTVTDTIGYSTFVVKQDLISVASGCVPLTAGDIAGWSPLSPVILDTVTFTATITPVGATQPITYTWDFGDGDGTTVSSATVQHAYTSAGKRTVSLTVYNPCTPSGVSRQIEITVVPHMIYLPLVIKGTP